MRHSTATPIPEVYRGEAGLSESARAVLEQPLTATVGTLNADGSIHLARVWFLFEDDRLYFESSSTTRKALNVEARGVLTMSVEATSATQTRWVSASGAGRIIDGADAGRIARRVRDKYITGAAAEAFAALFDRIDDICVELVAQQWMSWSDARISQALAARATGGAA